MPQRLLRLTVFLGGLEEHGIPSQTVFHNVCSGHAVLFLCFHDVDRMECHKTAARNYPLQEKINSTLLCLWGVVRVLYSFYEKG